MINYCNRLKFIQQTLHNMDRGSAVLRQQSLTIKAVFGNFNCIRILHLILIIATSAVAMIILLNLIFNKMISTSTLTIQFKFIMIRMTVQYQSMRLSKLCLTSTVRIMYPFMIFGRLIQFKLKVNCFRNNGHNLNSIIL